MIPQDPMTSLNPLYTIGNQILEAVELHSDLRGDKAKEVVIQALKMFIFLMRKKNTTLILINYQVECDRELLLQWL